MTSPLKDDVSFKRRFPKLTGFPNKPFGKRFPKTKIK